LIIKFVISKTHSTYLHHLINHLLYHVSQYYPTLLTLQVTQDTNHGAISRLKATTIIFWKL